MSKEIPQEALDTLPPDACLLGRMGEFKQPAITFVGWGYDNGYGWDHPVSGKGPYNSLGTSPGYIYAAPWDSEIIRANLTSKKPKPIKQWLYMLPEPYRGMALANCDGKFHKADSLGDAIYYAFPWPASRERGKFWEAVFDAIQNGSPLPPLPDDAKPEPSLSDRVTALEAKVDKLLESKNPLTDNPKPKLGQVWGFGGNTIMLMSNGKTIIIESNQSPKCVSQGVCSRLQVSTCGTYLGTFDEWLESQKRVAVEAYAKQVREALLIEDEGGDSVLQQNSPWLKDSDLLTREALAKLNPPIEA